MSQTSPPGGAQHLAQVDAWLKRSGKDLSAEELLRLAEAALGALWARIHVTLGEVTLAAIADRVLANTSEKFPLFAALKVEATGGVHWRDLQKQTSDGNGTELEAGIRFLLVEFLTVLGNLTAEILTPELHAVLCDVELPKAVHAGKGAPRSRADSAGKGKKP